MNLSKPAKMRRAGSPSRRRSAYLMGEALVYIAVVFVVLGVGYAAVYRATDYSVALRKNSEDIAATLQAGERWRADLRSAGGNVRVEDNGAVVVALPPDSKPVTWRFADGAVLRKSGEDGWVRMLAQVRSSRMEVDELKHVIAWRWELELEPRTKGGAKPGRIRPLFTFTAASPKADSGSPAKGNP